MMTTFGALRPGSLRVKLGPCAIAGFARLGVFCDPARRTARRQGDVNQPRSGRTWGNNEHARHAPLQVEDAPAGVGTIPALWPRPRHDHYHRKHSRKSVELASCPTTNTSATSSRPASSVWRSCLQLSRSCFVAWSASGKLPVRWTRALSTHRRSRSPSLSDASLTRSQITRCSTAPRATPLR